MRYPGVSWHAADLPLSFCVPPPNDLVWARWGSSELGQGVHLFVDDWRFQCLYRSGWSAQVGVGRFWATEPDCSLLWGMPSVVQDYQVYRARLGGHILRGFGLHVVPVVRWLTRFSVGSYGVQSGSCIAVRCPGNDPSALDLFRHGFPRVCADVRPSMVLAFGVSDRVRGSLDSVGVPWMSVPLRRGRVR